VGQHLALQFFKFLAVSSFASAKTVRISCPARETEKEQEDLTEHKQTAILNPASNMVINVDEGIAPLLQIIWNCGIMKNCAIFSKEIHPQ